MNFPYRDALDQLELEYSAMTGDSNPPKLSIPLAAIEHDGSLRRYANVMGAKLSDGSFGSKTVFVDELESRTGGTVSHFGADGELLYSLPASLVTPLRCGLMAALAMAMRSRMPTPRQVVVIGRGEPGDGAPGQHRDGWRARSRPPWPIPRLAPFRGAPRAPAAALTDQESVLFDQPRRQALFRGRNGTAKLEVTPSNCSVFCTPAPTTHRVLIKLIKRPFLISEFFAHNLLS
jgi:hypothetical protein